MVKYWYCLYDGGYMGNYNVHTTTSFKAACANLRKLLDNNASVGEGGCIYDSDPKKLAPRYEFDQIPPSLVAYMEIRDSKNRKLRLSMNPKVRVPAREYILSKRKPRTAMRYWPEYVVHYDGSLTAVKK